VTLLLTLLEPVSERCDPREDGRRTVSSLNSDGADLVLSADRDDCPD
jgi:hypothetical protein